MTPGGRWRDPGEPGAAPLVRGPERRRRSLSTGTPRCRGSARATGPPPPTWGPLAERRPAAGGSRSGRRLAVLLLVDVLGRTLAELALGLTQGPSELGDLGAAEDQQHDEEDDEQLASTDVRHGSRLPPYPGCGCW